MEAVIEDYIKEDFSEMGADVLSSKKEDFYKDNPIEPKYESYTNPFLSDFKPEKVKRVEQSHEASFENSLIPKKHEGDNRGLPTRDLYERVTGKDWSTASKEGLTDGSMEKNLELRRKLLNDGHILNQTTEVKKGGEVASKTINSKIEASSFNEAFKKAREQFGANHIFEYNGRKYGTNLQGEVFNPSEEVIKASGLDLPQTKKRLEEQQKRVFSPYVEQETVKLEEPQYSKWDAIKKRQKEDNKLGEVEKIIKHNNEGEGSWNYVIVDKKKGLVHLYERGNAEPLMTAPVGLGAEKSDAQTVTVMEDGKANFDKGNKATGAGIYTVSASNKVSLGGVPSFNLKNSNGIEVGTAFHYGNFTPDPQDELDRVSNGCIRCKPQTLKTLYSKLKVGDNVYILPEEEGNTFEFENGTLAFKARAKTDYSKYIDSKGEERKGQGANIKEKKEEYKSIKISIPNNIIKKAKSEDAKSGFLGKMVGGRATPVTAADKALVDENITPFAQSIVNNKKELMSKLNLSNDEYNDMATLALGIFGNESRFGTSAKYSTKEYMPALVNVGKSLKGDKSVNSRGLTQMKYDAYSDEAKGVLKDIGISSGDDLRDPSKAAKATIAILGLMYTGELKGTKLLRDSGVDWQDALMYLYQGKKRELTNKTATPESNKYITNVKKYGNSFTISQKNK